MYCHDTVMTVFCLSGIIMAQILAIFTKPSMFTLAYYDTGTITTVKSFVKLAPGQNRNLFEFFCIFIQV